MLNFRGKELVEDLQTFLRTIVINHSLLWIVVIEICYFQVIQLVPFFIPFFVKEVTFSSIFQRVTENHHQKKVASRIAFCKAGIGFLSSHNMYLVATPQQKHLSYYALA